jgi:hypothetical protein
MGSPEEFDRRAVAFFDGLHRPVASAPEIHDRAFISEAATSSRALVDDAGTPNLDALRSSAREHVKARRLSAESDGVILDGVVYDTAEGGLIRLVILLLFANRDPDFTASMQLRNGTVRRMTAPELYKVASAVANHMQACALWENGALAALDNAEAEDFATAEASIFDAIPAGDVTTPAPPGGTPAPLEFSGSRFQDVTCLSVSVTGDLTVSRNTTFGGALTVSGPTECSGAMHVGSLDAGSGQVQTSGAISAGSANVAREINSGSVACTGALAAGATTVSSLDSGSGVIKTTGQVFATAATITGALVAGLCTLSTVNATSATVSGSLSTGNVACNGTLSASATTVTSLDAKAGVVKTTGQVLAGSATITGALVAGLCTLTALNVGSVTATGRVAANTIACTGVLTAGPATTASLDAGSGAIKTTGTFAASSGVITNTLTSGIVSTTTLNVSQDAVVERLNARDKHAVGTMFLTPTTVKNSNWQRTGSFWWRKGDRRPTQAFAAYDLSSSNSKPNVAFWDPVLRTILGSSLGNAGEATAIVPIVTGTYVPNSNEFYQIEVYIGNSGSGDVTLTHYNVSTA